MKVKFNFISFYILVFLVYSLTGSQEVEVNFPLKLHGFVYIGPNNEPVSYLGVEFTDNYLCTFAKRADADSEFIQSLENLTKHKNSDKVKLEHLEKLCHQYDGLVEYWSGLGLVPISDNLEKFIKSLEVNIDNGKITGFGSSVCFLWWDLQKEHDASRILDRDLATALGYYNKKLYDTVMKAKNAHYFGYMYKTINYALNSACKDWVEKNKKHQ